ncbi:MAG: phosphatase PAP2 family protein [Clostridia bacterium]|nr:phosphatase PAP2 family protein [Clostridia bacterium]
MKSQTKSNIIITACLFLVFIIFTIIVKYVDVKAVGPLQSEVGLASINLAVFKVFGTSKVMYDITEILGYLTFLVIAFFAGLGLYQLIKYKSIKKVDYKILVLGGFYVVVLIFYALFEIVIVNYRPVLVEGGLEASYPSSHTMLSVCVISSAMIIASEMLSGKKGLSITVVIIGYALILLTVIGRLLSGVHWFTDIFGGVLLSFALIMLFYTAIEFIREKVEN